jgi:DNA-binding MarR family transcriptional regulator
MGPSRTVGNAELAAEVWRRMFDFFVSTRPQRDRVLEGLELTPNDARALSSLDAEHGRTMGSLAEEWGCDASNATFIVDRLERRGLVERRMSEGDRRARHVLLTKAGEKTKARLIDGIYQTPPELLAAERATLEALRTGLARLSSGDRATRRQDRRRPTS